MRKLIEYLEKDVDEKYYIKPKQNLKIISKTDKKLKVNFSTFNQENYITDPNNENLGTITATGANSKQKILIEIPEQNFKNYLYLPDKNGEIKGNSHERVWKDKYIGTIATSNKIKILTEVKQNDKLVIKYNDKFYNVRVITPKEAFRLMGFSDLDYSRAKEVISENQLYKVAGNSIVVPVAEHIIKTLNLPKKIKFLDLFAGIGAMDKALKNLGYDITDNEVVEIDKNAISAFNAIHDTNFQAIDIKDFEGNGTGYDYIHASTPCQAFSIAGKNLGQNDERGAKLWIETLRIIEKYKPKIFTMENVKGLLQQKHSELLEFFINEMKKLNYEIEIKMINAKDFIPQNRERVFIIAKRR